MEGWDNPDDEDVFFPPLHGTMAVGATDRGQAAELLSDFLSRSPNGSILVTSRSQDVAYTLTGSRSSIIEVKPIDKERARGHRQTAARDGQGRGRLEG